MNTKELFFVSLLALMAAWYSWRDMAAEPDQIAWNTRIISEAAVIEGCAIPPYRYRLANTALRLGAEKVWGWVDSPLLRWTNAQVTVYGIAAWVAFTGAFLFWRRLVPGSELFSCAMLSAILPATNVHPWDAGDLITLAGFSMGMWAGTTGRAWMIPPFCAVMATNREQGFLLPVFVAAWAISSRDYRPLRWCAAAIAVHFVVQIAMTEYAGYVPSAFTAAFHLRRNFATPDAAMHTIGLWVSQVIPFFVLAAVSWRLQTRAMRVWLLMLFPYIAAYSVKGYLWEGQKFLPAFLFLLPAVWLALRGVIATTAQVPRQPR